MAGDHGGAHGASHDTDGLPHGEHHLGKTGGMSGHHEVHPGKGVIFVVNAHHDLHYHSRFSFPLPLDHSAPGGAAHQVTAIDPIRDTVTLDESIEKDDVPTHTWMAYWVNHGPFDHEAKFRAIVNDLNANFFAVTAQSPAPRRKFLSRVHAGLRTFAHRITSSRKKLIRIDNKVPNLSGSKAHAKKLLAFHALTDAPNPANMPDGYLPGFDGETWEVKQLWHLGPYMRKYRNYEYDREANTWLEIVWVTWYFKQTASYTSRVTIRVKSRELYGLQAARWGKVGWAFDEHQNAAKYLISRISDELSQAHPNPLSKDLLRLYGEQAMKRKQGAYSAPEDIEKELDDANLEEVERKDSDPRRTGGQAGPPGVGWDDSPGQVGTGNDPNAPPAPGPAPAPGGLAPADEPAEDGGGDEPSGFPPMAPMGIASGADLNNTLGADKTKAKSGEKRPVWQPPVDKDLVPVTVKVHNEKK